MLLNLLFIGTGGFLGAVSRYIIYEIVSNFYHKSHFPLGTLIVNVVGSLIIGILFAIALKHQIFKRHTIEHYFFITGFLGAFTTFSTFSQDNLVLILDKHYVLLASNILLNLILGLVFVAIGYFIVNKSF